MTDEKVLEEVYVYRAQKKINDWLAAEVFANFRNQRLSESTLKNIEGYCEGRLAETRHELMDSAKVRVKCEVIERVKICLTAYWPGETTKPLSENTAANSEDLGPQ